MTGIEATCIGVIGLGNMGGAMAQALLEAGHAVSGYDPTAAAMSRLAVHGGRGCADACEVASASNVVLLSLPSTEALLETARLMAATPARDGPRRVVVETSTLPLDTKRRAADVLQSAGFAVLDCPISGTVSNPKQRTWTMYCSGDKATYLSVLQVLQKIAFKTFHVGEYGCGTKMKIAANHLVAIYNVAYGESVNLARELGLDPDQFLELMVDSPVLSTGIMRLRMPFMVHRTYLPATMTVQLWQKDVSLIADMARSVNCPVPLLSACAPIYDSAMAQGWGQQDAASVSEVFGHFDGVARLPAPSAPASMRRSRDDC